VTDLLTRDANVAAPAAAAGRREHAASVWVRGAFAALWASAVGLAGLTALALVVWSADSRSEASAGDAARLAAQLWLLAQRTPLRVAGGTLTIPLLGLTLLLGLLVMRATAIVARASHCAEPRDLGVVVASVVGPYAVIATVVAAIARSSAIRPVAGAAFVCAAVLGGLFAAIGAVRGAGMSRQVWRLLPYEVRTALQAAGAAGAALVSGAAVLTVVALGLHVHRMVAIAGDYGGAPGEFATLLLSLLLLPNAVMAALGYLVGPGFAVGAGASVTLGGAHVGAVPALPLLAAMPTGPAPWPVLAWCVVVVVAAGVVAGRRVARRSTQGVKGQLRCVLLAAATLGVGAAAVVGFAGGPAGPGRLAAVGSSPWQVGLCVAAEVGVVAAVVVALAAAVQVRRDGAVVQLPSDDGELSPAGSG
jgi:Family of unknown function (DUF6350)